MTTTKAVVTAEVDFVALAGIRWWASPSVARPWMDAEASVKLNRAEKIAAF